MLSKNFEYTGHLPYFFQIRFADDIRAALGHRVAQRKPIAPVYHVAEALVRHSPLVGGLGGGAEPTLVDAARGSVRTRKCHPGAT